MKTSLNWLNSYLDRPVSADELSSLLPNVGFPIDSTEDVVTTAGSRDLKMEVEITSNRSDCLSHVGLARETSAAGGMSVKQPDCSLPDATGPAIASLASVEVRDAKLCPLYTARVIKGVKIGPSPRWMQAALESVGQRPINAVVDVTNYINFELGHPCHVFDLDSLTGRRLIVRPAHPGEPFTALDGRTHTLSPDELVVADERRAVSLAGVIGGVDSSVTERTTTVLLEMATWDPVRVRRAARRLDIRTDAGHRFERFVDPREIDFPAQRAAELIVECCGGEVLGGLIDARAELPAPTVVTLRPARCEHLLGLRIDPGEITRLLTALAIGVERHNDLLRCTIPPFRPDLTREVDLIEEVARLHAIDRIPVAPSLDVRIDLSHPEGWASRERATEEVGRVLTGAGFFETVTFSFVPEHHARLFLPPGHRALKVDEARRKDTPFLRPSIVPSLLTCRRANQNAQTSAPGGIKLFEIASVFAEIDDGPRYARQTLERRILALLHDAAHDHASMQDAVRRVRGAVESVVRALAGSGATVEFEPCNPSFIPAYEGETAATIRINGNLCAYLTTISRAGSARLLDQWGLEAPVVVAEIGLDALLALYPPVARVHTPPRFPAIERDLSLILDEPVEWAAIERALADGRDPRLESLEFVGAFRGKPVPQGKKSVTLRLTFREPERTLRNEEIDEPVQAIVDRMASALGATLRAPGA